MAKYKVTISYSVYVDNVSDKYDAIETAYDNFDKEKKDPKITVELISE